MRLPLQIELLASEAVAKKILDVERLTTAELRLDMIERHDKHMCLEPACREPVIGKLVFAHCEKHLTELERRWLAEDIESPNYKRPPQDPSEHPWTTMTRLAKEQRELEIGKELYERKEKALSEARTLIDNNYRLKRERRSYIPAKLRSRIQKAYEALMKDLDESNSERWSS